MAARMLNKLWRRGSIGRVRVKVVGWGVRRWEGEGRVVVAWQEGVQRVVHVV